MRTCPSKSLPYSAFRCGQLILFSYFQDIDRLFELDYTPDDQDILYSRFKTTGIIETIFDCGTYTCRMFDVGGQRSERKKWIHCFENVHCLMFVVAISAYDQCRVEDREGVSDPNENPTAYCMKD
jgi:hypothetical protein